MRRLAGSIASAFIALTISGSAIGDVVTKKGLVIPQRFESALKAAPPQEWKNPKTGKPYATWKEALDEADDLEDDDEDDDDGNVIETTRKPTNAKELLEAMKDADEDAARKRTQLRGYFVSPWAFPTTLAKMGAQDVETDKLDRAHKAIEKDEDDDDSPDDDEDVGLKRFLKVDDDKSGFLIVPQLDYHDALADWWRPKSSRKAFEETDEMRKARIEKAKRKLKCTREGKECYPKRDGNWTSFNRDLGDDDIAEVWTHALFGMRHRTSDQLDCNGSWDTGITILRKKFSLVKLNGDASSDSDRSAIKGSASVYLLGQSVWSKSGNVKENFSRTFKTEKREFEFPLLPFLSVTGGAQASATFELKTRLDATAVARSGLQRAKCALNLVPGMTSKLLGEGGVSVGIPKVARLAHGGIRVKLAPLSADIPSNLGVATQKADRIPRGSLFFRSNADANLMAGKVEAFYRLGDICTPRVRVCVPYFGCKTIVGKKCFVKDVLGIPTKGSKTIWKHKGWAFKKKLVDRSAKIAWVTREEQTAVKKP